MFYINTENVRSAVTLFSSGEQTLKNLSHQVDDVSHQISGLSGMNDVISTLDYLSGQMRQEATKLGQLYESGNRIAREYERAEEDILNNQEGVGTIFEGGATLQDFSGQGASTTPSNKIDYGTLEELSGLFF